MTTVLPLGKRSAKWFTNDLYSKTNILKDYTPPREKLKSKWNINIVNRENLNRIKKNGLKISPKLFRSTVVYEGKREVLETWGIGNTRYWKHEVFWKHEVLETCVVLRILSVIRVWNLIVTEWCLPRVFFFFRRGAIDPTTDQSFI